MVTLTANDAVLAVLGQVKELAEIRDASGTVIGFFAPANGLGDSKLNPLEIARRKAANQPGRSTREVFEHLLSLTKDDRLRADLQNRIDVLKERDACGSPSSGN